MRYVFSAGKSLTAEDVEQIIHQLETNYPEGREVAMTLADMWRDEGIQIGIQQGIEKGMEKGESAALSETTLQLLTQKFGKVPRDVKEGILNLDNATLKIVLFDILRYEQIEDVKNTFDE